jgi:hypothetical protein
LALPSLALFEPIAVAVQFEDVDVVGQSVEHDPKTTRFLAKVTPLLGSPLDDRLNILCGETYVDGTGCVPP